MLSQVKNKELDKARATPKTTTVGQAGDDYKRFKRLNGRIKMASHNEHATEGATWNYNRFSASPLQTHNWILHVAFHMCPREMSWKQVYGPLLGKMKSTLNKSTTFSFSSTLMFFHLQSTLAKLYGKSRSKAETCETGSF